MTTLDKSTKMERVDATFHYTGFLVRALGYLFVYAIVDRYDFGRPILTGVLFGDFVGQLVRIAWNWRHDLLIQLGELFLLGIVFLFVQSMMVWPENPAMRAIVGLAAFSMLTGHIARTVITRLGPNEY